MADSAADAAAAAGAGSPVADAGAEGGAAKKPTAKELRMAKKAEEVGFSFWFLCVSKCGSRKMYCTRGICSR
jgi:hypothetical protein